NRDRLGARRNWRRVVGDWLRSNRLLIILGNGRGSFGPYNLRWRLRRRLVASDLGRRSLLAGRRSRPLDRRRYFRPGATGVGESDPVIRGRELQVLFEVIIH